MPKSIFKAFIYDRKYKINKTMPFEGLYYANPKFYCLFKLDYDDILINSKILFQTDIDYHNLNINDKIDLGKYNIVTISDKLRDINDNIIYIINSENEYIDSTNSKVDAENRIKELYKIQNEEKADFYKKVYDSYEHESQSKTVKWFDKILSIIKKGK